MNNIYEDTDVTQEEVNKAIDQAINSSRPGDLLAGASFSGTPSKLKISFECSSFPKACLPLLEFILAGKCHSPPAVTKIQSSSRSTF